MSENPEQNTEKRELIVREEMGLEEKQLAEQLYAAAGLDPVVEAGLKDYDKRVRGFKWIDKIYATDQTLRGYGQAVAKRTALAIYTQLSKQYGGRVGDLARHITLLEEERDRAIAQRDQANARYDDLVAKGIGALAEGYKDLRIDSKEFMERLTAIAETDREKPRIDLSEVAERLADIEGLRSQIKTLNKEKEEQKEKYEAQIAEHNEKIGNLESRIAELDLKIKESESDKTILTAELEGLKEAIKALGKTIPYQEIEEKLGEELYSSLLKDSKAPDFVINWMGPVKKYLKMAIERGAKEATKRAEEILKKS